MRTIVEEWKEIDKNYLVSNLGNVKSKSYKRTGKAKILKPWLDNGYYVVQIGNKRRSIHTLVWDLFGNGQRNGMKIVVDHINECKTDNRIENLQLLSTSQNVKKSFMMRNASNR